MRQASIVVFSIPVYLAYIFLSAMLMYKHSSNTPSNHALNQSINTTNHLCLYVLL